jgi:hypothetical protein
VYWCADRAVVIQMSQLSTTRLANVIRQLRGADEERDRTCSCVGDPVFYCVGKLGTTSTDFEASCRKSAGKENLAESSDKRVSAQYFRPNIQPIYQRECSCFGRDKCSTLRFYESKHSPSSVEELKDDSPQPTNCCYCGCQKG